LIDGPSAYKSEIAHSRYYALPFVKDLLDDNYVIFLDDANRTGEKEVMQMWSNEFGKKFHIYAETLGVFYQGNHFECNPIKNITIN
ncbi:MAG: hypothetical protein NTZ41_00995, partial [Sphingobacteriales bacterium]|nr:hypothetical protein [Sphingobacteriales bacterium]